MRRSWDGQAMSDSPGVAHCLRAFLGVGPVWTCRVAWCRRDVSRSLLAAPGLGVSPSGPGGRTRERPAWLSPTPFVGLQQQGTADQPHGGDGEPVLGAGAHGSPPLGPWPVGPWSTAVRRLLAGSRCSDRSNDRECYLL